MDNYKRYPDKCLLLPAKRAPLTMQRVPNCLVNPKKGKRSNSHGKLIEWTLDIQAGKVHVLPAPLL
jgi:hypothetical protein